MQNARLTHWSAPAPVPAPTSSVVVLGRFPELRIGGRRDGRPGSSVDLASGRFATERDGEVACVLVPSAIVAALPSDRTARQEAARLCRVARRLGFRTVATDVCTVGQLRALIELGCDEAEGALFGPVPEGADPVEGARLQERNARVVAFARASSVAEGC